MKLKKTILKILIIALINCFLPLVAVAMKGKSMANMEFSYSLNLSHGAIGNLFLNDFLIFSLQGRGNMATAGFIPSEYRKMITKKNNTLKLQCVLPGQVSKEVADESSCSLRLLLVPGEDFIGKVNEADTRELANLKITKFGPDPMIEVKSFVLPDYDIMSKLEQNAEPLENSPKQTDEIMSLYTKIRGYFEKKDKKELSVFFGDQFKPQLEKVMAPSWKPFMASNEKLNILFDQNRHAFSFVWKANKPFGAFGFAGPDSYQYFEFWIYRSKNDKKWKILPQGI